MKRYHSKCRRIHSSMDIMHAPAIMLSHKHRLQTSDSLQITNIALEPENGKGKEYRSCHLSKILHVYVGS